jgi:hypothetical protein
LIGVLRSKKQHELPWTEVSSENASQKVFIRNDTISETVNDSDSNGGNFSKFSDEACKVRPVPVAVRSKA